MDVHVGPEYASIAWNKKISHSKLLDTIRQFEPGTLVAMEACATSHFWGRTFASTGYCVRLIPAQHVKAFVRSQKNDANDANDALAICETAFRTGIHFVSVKTTEQQDTHQDQLEGFISYEGAKQRHLGNTPNPERYNPDLWEKECHRRKFQFHLV